jgi:ABC-type multidrug transport system fused ATPase/permease subunit
MSLSLLDLLGVALIGVVAAIAASGVGAQYALPNWVAQILELLNLGSLTVSQLTVAFALIAVGVLILKTLLQALIARRIYRFLAYRQAEVSADLAREFLSRPLLFVQRWTTSEAIYALGSGVGAATVAVLGSAITIVSEITLFIILLVALFAVDFMTATVAIVIFATVVSVSHRILSRRSQRNAQIMTEASISTLTAVSEALNTYRETSVLNRRELYVARYQGLVSRFAQATANNSFLVEIPKYVLEATLYVAVVLLGVTQFLLNKNLTEAATTTAVFLAAGMRLVPALLRLQGAGITIRNAAVSAQPTYYLADALNHAQTANAQAILPVIDAQKLKAVIAAGHGSFDASLSIDCVSVTYEDSNQAALDGVSFHAAAGTSVALVGSTGAGKSTLADVLIGALEPDSGSVLINGVQPREAITRWPGAVAYVPQAVALVVGTVRDNVALGLPADAVDEDLVWEALTRAHLAEFLRSNRDGLDTYIGERGVRLSGGQRQRLGIARALYTKPRLLVLDEATSALDAETERAIVEMLDELEGEVTTVTIAHRLATVMRADQLLYLEHGRVAAHGSFEQVRLQAPDFDRQAALLGL